MTKLAWATDIHLDFLTNADVVAFANKFNQLGHIDGVVLTGDISTSQLLVQHLSTLEAAIQRPIYFVLGNHDFYGSSIEQVRKQMQQLSKISPYLKYMSQQSYISVAPSTAVVGHDGWYDGLYGDWKNSRFLMSDWAQISEFVAITKNATNFQIGAFSRKDIIEVAQNLAMEAVKSVHESIKGATRYYKHIIVLTHFPPFAEAHIYNGRTGDARAMPFYTSKLMGNMLLQAAAAFPNVKFTVLAGHTHGKYSGLIKDNLAVNVGSAEYYKPEIQNVIEV